MKCYGTYKAGRQACRSCDLSDYCKTAHDPPLTGAKGVPFEGIEYAEEYGIEPDIVGIREDLGNCSELATILGEMLVRMRSPEQAAKLLSFITDLLGLAVNHPKTMAVTIEKLLNPELSYADIARKLGCDKQLVHHHLKRAKQLLPRLETAILVDQRFNARSCFSRSRAEDSAR